MKSSWRFKVWRLIPAAVAGVLLLVYLLRHTPVFLHVFADSGCACGEYHGEVTGLVVFNPLRDRTPEKTAAHFLAELRAGKCTDDPSFCHYAFEHNVSEWRLTNRRDDAGTVSLYYKLTKKDVIDPQYRLTGAGLVKVAKAHNNWTVTYYSSYF